MSEINYNIGLCGEYRLVVRDNDVVVNDTGWCKNTILSGGLEFLSTNSILSAVSFVDFGTNSSSSNDYTLSGVLTPCINSSLLDIPSGNIQLYTVDTSTQVYYSIYSSPPISLQNETINEFCIKTFNKTGFARAVFPEAVGVRVGQNVNFEYRVSVDHSGEYDSNVEFKTPDNTSFYLPVTSKTFNIPNIENTNQVGRLVDEYNLLLVQNNDEFPAFGDTYPDVKKPLVCGVGSSTNLSRFKPSTVYSGIDDTTKQYSVITLYNNISAPFDSGIFNNINSAVLTYNDLAFHVTRFAFPLALYNTTLYTDITSANTSNLISLYYQYTWGENIESPFTTPLTFNLSAPQLIPCNIDQEVDLYPDSFITLFSNTYTTPNVDGNTTRIRVNLKGSTFFEKIDISYFTSQIDKTAFPYGPSPYRVLVYNSNNDAIRDTGYVFPDTTQSWDYINTPLDSLNYYNARLYSANNQSIVGSISGNTILTNVSAYPGNDYIDLVVNSPFTGTSWKVILDTRIPQSETICSTEQTNICLQFEDVGYGVEYLTLSGSLISGIYNGFNSLTYPVSIEWNDSLGSWEFFYNNTPLITGDGSMAVITGATDRCNPVNASISYQDGIMSVDAQVLNFGGTFCGCDVEVYIPFLDSVFSILSGKDTYTLGYAPWRTEDIIADYFANSIISTGEDDWQFIPGFGPINSVIFGFNCVEEIDLEFNVIGGIAGSTQYSVYVNGNLITSAVLDPILVTNSSCTINIPQPIAGTVLEIAFTGSDCDLAFGITDVR
jgi:hypothetical protein